MPTRLLKPGVRDSDAINSLSPLGEALFYRLLVTVDDFGRYDARPAMIKSQCFPIKEAITPSKCAALLEELTREALVRVYEVDGKPYLQMGKWDNVPRAQVSKFPAPPHGMHEKELREIVSEDDLERMICASINVNGEFAGLTVISHARQVRKDQSYFDIVLTTPDGQVGIELKRTRVSKAAVDQVVRYQAMTGIPFVLLASGLGAGIDVSECAANNIAVVTYTEDFKATVILGNSVIKRDFTLHHVHGLTETETVTDIREPEPEPVIREALRARREQVATVFDHWRSTMNHPKAVLDDKRRKMIETRIKDGYSLADLMDAITGCSLSPFHMGQNDQGARYDGLELILRAVSQVDKFIAIHRKPPRALGRQGQIEARNQAAVDEFLGDGPIIDMEVSYG